MKASGANISAVVEGVGLMRPVLVGGLLLGI